jgi:hypothetical protein
MPRAWNQVSEHEVVTLTDTWPLPSQQSRASGVGPRRSKGRDVSPEPVNNHRQDRRRQERNGGSWLVNQCLYREHGEGDDDRDDRKVEERAFGPARTMRFRSPQNCHT